MKTTIFIDGGIGRVIAATGAITEYAKQNGETHVITPHVSVFRGNKDIIVHSNDDRRIFSELINTSDKYIELEPYKMVEFFKEGKHMINCISIQLGLGDNFYNPIIFLSEKEDIEAKTYCKGKNIVLVQPFGSSVSNANDGDDSYRSMKLGFAYELGHKLTELGYIPIQIGVNQLEVGTMQQLNVDIRNIIALTKYAKFSIGCDSFLNHARKALGFNSISLRAGTDEKRFGYIDDIIIREHPLIGYVPLRLPINDFELYNINVGTNNFSEKTIDLIISNMK